MISHRTLLLYNFGAGIAFAVIGWLSTSAIDTFLPSLTQKKTVPTLQAKIRNELADEQDLEHLKSQALFYFDLAKDLKNARNEDDQNSVEEISRVCFVLAAVFMLGGAMAAVAKPAVAGKPKPVGQAGASPG